MHCPFRRAIFPALFVSLGLLFALRARLLAGRVVYTTRSTDPSTKVILGFPLTRFLAHAPGFSVIQNCYWYKGTLFFVTDSPWAIPELNKVINLSVDWRTPTRGRIAARIIAIRNGPLTGDVNEKLQLGESLSLDEALLTYGGAEVIDEGPILMNNDDDFINHYYHWIGETFLGAWRIWNHHAWVTGLTLPAINRVSFHQQYSHATAPEGQERMVWEDKIGANAWFLEKFFPDAVIESKDAWDARRASNKVYRMPLLLLADRTGGHNGPSSSHKPWGDVLRLSVASDWLTQIRDRVFVNSQGSIPLGMPEKPVVTYLTRQDTGRRLRESDHEGLWSALQMLESEGVAEVNVETFNSSVTFGDQVAKIARTTILVGVHGNGLTHCMWMTPTPRSAVFEMQSRNCTITDYSGLAVAAGIRHFMVNDDTLCEPLNCPSRGCRLAEGDELKDGINSVDIRVTPSVVVHKIRQLLAD